MENVAPKIELKSISVNMRCSEETYCYSATLYVDGEKKGEVRNHGYGGPDDNDLTIQENLDLEERIKNTFPKEVSEYFPDGLEQSLELVCGNIIGDYLALRDMKRKLASKALFVVEGKTGVWEYSYGTGIRSRKRRKPDAELFQALRGKYPKATILNQLTANKALEIYLREVAVR